MQNVNTIFTVIFYHLFIPTYTLLYNNNTHGHVYFVIMKVPWQGLCIHCAIYEYNKQGDDLHSKTSSYLH